VPDDEIFVGMPCLFYTVPPFNCGVCEIQFYFVFQSSGAQISGFLIVKANTFCTMVPNICGSSVFLWGGIRRCVVVRMVEALRCKSKGRGFSISGYVVGTFY